MNKRLFKLFIFVMGDVMLKFDTHFIFDILSFYLYRIINYTKNICL